MICAPFTECVVKENGQPVTSIGHLYFFHTLYFYAKKIEKEKETFESNKSKKNEGFFIIEGSKIVKDNKVENSKVVEGSKIEKAENILETSPKNTENHFPKNAKNHFPKERGGVC